jgi:hypothetical protein
MFYVRHPTAILIRPSLVLRLCKNARPDLFLTVRFSRDLAGGSDEAQCRGDVAGLPTADFGQIRTIG